MKKILIVEDNEDSRVLLYDLMIANGYEVKSSENGKRALLEIEKNFTVSLKAIKGLKRYLLSFIRPPIPIPGMSSSL